MSSPQIRQLLLFISSFKVLAHKRKATKSREAQVSTGTRHQTSSIHGQDRLSPQWGVGRQVMLPPPLLPWTPTCSCPRVKGQNLAGLWPSLLRGSLCLFEPAKTA